MADQKHLICFLFFLLLTFFVLASTEIGMVEGKVCGRRSKLWTGFCVDSICDRQCREVEGALYGACHVQYSGSACFCYYNC